MPQIVYTPKEAAEILKVKPITIYRWCRANRIPCIRLSRGYRITERVINDILDRSIEVRRPESAGDV
jgi:excisionase family DNA binding protein